MTTTNDISKAVANVLPALQQRCPACRFVIRDDVTLFQRDCSICENRGWLPTRSLEAIITNLEYPFTLVLSNDMIGWCAEIVLDGDTPTGKDKKAYDDPVYAVYEALFEALTDKLGAGRTGRFINLPRRTRGRGRPIKSVRAIQESVKWLQPGSES